MSLLLAQAAVNDANIHFDKLYSYRIPAELAGRVFPGSMVLVPFGRGSKARMAVVLAVGEVDESDAPKGLKTLYDAAPEDARLTPDLLELVRFLKSAPSAPGSRPSRQSSRMAHSTGPLSWTAGTSCKAA